MLTIDSSTNKTGISVWDNGDFKSSFVLDFSKNKEMDSRFKQMSLSLIETLCKYKPQIIYVEETVVARNQQIQRFLTRLQGVIYGYCILNDCEFNTIRPSEWRKLVDMNQSKKKRDELKMQAINMVNELFGLNVSDDEAEAILIGQAVVNRFANFSR